MIAQNERLPLLDAYRFAAAFAVIGYHYWGTRTSDLRISLSHGSIFSFPQLDLIFRYGWFGVDLFFLISGFVIALSAEGRGFSAFTASRLARIVPTYWLCVLLTTLFILFEGSGYREVHLRQFIVNLIFLQRPLGEQFIDAVYWTIVIELRFYLMVAVLIALNLYRFYPYFLLLWVGLAVLDYLQIPIGPLKQLFITTYGYYFAAGGAFFLLYRRRHIRIALATLFAALAVALPKAIEFNVTYYGQDAATPAAFILLACFGLMALVAARILREQCWPWLSILGGLTYPLYLIHEDIGFILMRHIDFSGDGFVVTAIVMILMLAGAWIINQGFESRVLSAVRKWLEAGLDEMGAWMRRFAVVGKP